MTAPPISWITEDGRRLRINRYAVIIETSTCLWAILCDRGQVVTFPLTLAPLFRPECPSTTLPIPLMDYLLSCGLLVDWYTDETIPVKALALAALERTRTQAHSLSVHLFLTHACDLRCIYCIQGHDLKGSGRRFSTPAIERLFDVLPEIAHSLGAEGIDRLTLFGGEPLLASGSTIETAIRRGSILGLRIGVSTNALSYSRKRKAFSCVPVTFLISLDGLAPIHDQRRRGAHGEPTFTRTVMAIDQILSDGHRVVLQPILDTGNVDGLRDLLDFMCEKGWLSNPQVSVRCGLRMFPNAAVDTCPPDDDPSPAIIGKLLALRRSFPFLDIGFNAMLKPEAFLDRVLEKGKAVPITSGCLGTNLGDLSFSPDGLIYACREEAGRGETRAIGRFQPRVALFPQQVEAWRRRVGALDDTCLACRFLLLCGGGCPIQRATAPDKGCPPFEIHWRAYLDALDRDIGPTHCIDSDKIEIFDDFC